MTKAEERRALLKNNSQNANTSSVPTVNKAQERRKMLKQNSNSQALPYIDTNGKLDPFALTQGVQNIAQKAKQEQTQNKINEITGGQPTAFIPRTLNVAELETAEQEFKENQAKQNNNVVKQTIKNIGVGAMSTGANILEHMQDNNAFTSHQDSMEALAKTAKELYGDKNPLEMTRKERMAEKRRLANFDVGERQQEIIEERAFQRYKDTDKVTQALRDIRQQEIEDTAQLPEWQQKIANAGMVVGDMGPTILAGYLGGPAAANTTLFLNAKQNAYNQAIENGATHRQADVNSVLSATGELALETLSGGAFNKLAKIPGVANVSKFTQGIKNPIARGTVNLIGDVFGEGVEESISTAVQPLIDRITYNPTAPLASIQDVWTSFTDSIIPTLMFGGINAGSNVIQKTAIRKNADQVANKQKAEIEKANLPENEKAELKKQVDIAKEQAVQQIIENAEKNVVSESSQIEQTQPTNEVTPPVQQNQNTVKVARNNANVQNVAQNDAKIQQSLGINQENTQVPTEIQTFIETRNKTAPGLKVEMDSTLNTDGVIIKNADGTRVMKINPKSTRAYEFVAVHEMLHDLENTPEFKELSEFVKQRAITHEDFEKAKQAITEQYQKYYQENNLDMSGLNMEIETTNDMVAQALGNQQFLNELAGQKPNVFIRLYNWIKNVAFDGRNTGKTFTERRADNKYLQELKKKFETAYNTAYKGNSGQQFDIITTADNKRYAKATRQVIKGNDASKWGEQVEKYINEEIRKGQDVSFYGADGELLTITRDTAGKAKFRNEVTMADGTKRKLTDDEYKAKLEAETHIDELAQISKHKNGPVADTKNHSFAKDGFNYRTAYFEDSDGKYYKITMSVGKNGEINTIYNVGQMKNAQKNRSNTSNRGLKGPSDKIAKGSTTSTNSIPSQSQSVNNISESSFSIGENQPKTDNKGRELTQEQQEYFKDSKVRDEEGRLLEVYHGTGTKGINIFQYDPKRQTGTDYGEAYYFTSDYTKAEGYGYDITKDPRFIESEKESEAARKRMVAEDFSEESRKHFDEVNKKYNIFEIINDEEYIHNNYDIVGGEVKKLYLNLANPLIVDAEGQYYFKVYDKYFKQARENGNDGIIVKNVIDVARGEHRPIDVYIAFNNNQFKNVDNTNPTENPDIRYSQSNNQSNDEWAKYLSENWDLMPNAKKTSTLEQYQVQQEDKRAMLPTAEQLNQLSQEMIEAAQALTLEEKENVTEKSQELFDELFANEDLPQTYKFKMGERIEKATTSSELDKIRNEIKNYKSDLSKETIDERVVRVNEFLEAQKTKGEKITKKEIRNKITDLLEIPNKGGNVKALSQIAGEINELLVEGKLTDTKINEIVESLPERVRTINEEYLNEYGELKNELKKRAIYVSENVRKGFANWNDFKKSNLNKLKLTKDTQNITVEQLYQELSSQYEDLFPSDISNPADQLQQISDVVSSIKRDVGDVDTALIGKYGQEGWNEIQDMLKDELKTIRDNLARTNEPIEYYEGGIKNRSYTKTAKKNDLVNEFLDVKDIQYQVQSNPSTVRMANETINNLGYEESYNLIKNTINSGKRVTATDIALGERLIQESIKKGDFERATELITDVTIIGTELGQAVQAMRLINKMSPQGQLMYLQKVVNRMNAQNAQKNAKRDNKKLNELETKVEKGEQIKIGDNEIKIPEESQQELLKAQTQEEIDLAIEKIKEQLAAQLPVETFEKLDEWRYLSMLGRPKSHLRNVLSNIAMRGTYELKNEIQRGVEALAKNSLDERTRTFKKSTETVKNFAKQSAEDNLNAIKGNGKLTVDKDIKARRKIFKNEVLERARKFNSNALDMEDTVFSKSAYVSNLAEYLTANGIKTQQDIDLNPDIVEKGIQFAIKESQKTTFRQYSALANAMNQIENINGFSKVVIGGTLPFKKTPINIAKTGASYSPAGLIETLTLETKKLRDGQITGNEYIDRLSQGLTGTLITGLGYLLADIGVLSGAGEEDDEYAEAIGERAPYSINIGNGHYNLSWLSPTAMPMFIGAEIQKAVQNEEDVDLNNIVDFLATTLDPLSEMSMVSSINDAIKNYGSSETSTGAISSVASNAVGSYAGQYLPSIFSDINKIIDPTVRSTQASKNSKFKSGERFLRQSLNKLPGGSYLLEPATDIWGNEKKRSDSIFARAADALISPGTYTEKKTTEVDRELLMLYDENSNKDIIPKVPKNYFSSNGYKYEMSAKEYTNYKKEYGQTAYKELQKLFSSKEYKEMDSEDKQKAIKDVYEKAQEKARFEYGLNPKTLLSKYDELEASRRLLGAKRSEKQQSSGVTLIDFYNAWQAQKDVEGTKNWKGKSITGSEKENKIKAMKEAVPDLKSWQLNKLYDLLN